MPYPHGQPLWGIYPRSTRLNGSTDAPFRRSESAIHEIPSLTIRFPRDKVHGWVETGRCCYGRRDPPWIAPMGAVVSLPTRTAPVGDISAFDSPQRRHGRPFPGRRELKCAFFLLFLAFSVREGCLKRNRTTNSTTCEKVGGRPMALTNHEASNNVSSACGRGTQSHFGCLFQRPPQKMVIFYSVK